MTPGDDEAPVDVVFEQRDAQEPAPMSHLSLELGNLHHDDFAEGVARLDEHFAAVAPWARHVLAQNEGRRVSTCFLVDDYFAPSDPHPVVRDPRRVIPMLCEAAEHNGLTIDYLARESVCVSYRDRGAGPDAMEPARILTGQLVADPPPGTDGFRPVPQVTGWLANGERSPVVTTTEAMSSDGT